MTATYQVFIRIYLAVCVPVLIMLVSVLIGSWMHRPAVVSVYFLDVGQGDSIYVRLPDNISMLIDGGPDNHLLDSLGRVMPWWDHSIDYIIISHPDRDHFAGLLGVAEKYEVGAVLYNGDDGDWYYKMMLDAFRERGSEMMVLHKGDELTFARDIDLRFVWPPQSYAGEDKNSRSLTALLSWRDVDLLFTGDLPQYEEERMLRTEQLPRTEVLKVGHHGSQHSTGEKLLSAIRPVDCVISAGADNSYGHPALAVLQRLADAGCNVLETMHSGTITLRNDGFHVWEPLPNVAF